MDQARPWTWAKRKHGLLSTNSHDHQHLLLHHHHHHQNYVSNKASYNEDSWEEQAFAEDSSGALGGCIWPPRSYSCSFCRREFRSAQALGGHMNVHRRDRARLKQSPPDLHRDFTPQNTNIPLHQNHISPLMITSLNGISGGGGNTSTCTSNTISTSHTPQFPSQLCALVYNPNPNSDHLVPNHDLIASPPLPPLPQQQQQKQHPCNKKSCHDDESQEFPHRSSSTSFLLQENHQKWSNNIGSQVLNPSPNISWSNLASTADRCYSHKPNQKDPDEDHPKVSSISVESGGSCTRPKRDCHHCHHHVKTDLSVSLNLVLCRSCPTTVSGGYDHKEDDHLISTCKRRKLTDDEEEVCRRRHGGVLRPDELDDHDRVSPCSVEELDLELRIGVGPHKVK